MLDRGLSAPKASLGLRRTAKALASSLNHPAAIYIASLAPGSRRCVLYEVRKFAELLGHTPASLEWHRLTYAQVALVRSMLCEKFEPSTVNHCISALRGVLRACVRLDLMDRESMLKAIDVEPARGTSLPPGRSLTQDELARLFKAAKSRGDVGMRDRALLAVVYGCGLRRLEAASLNLDNLSEAGLKTVGKGNKTRLVPIPATVRPAIADWLEVRGNRPGPLFHRFSANGPTTNRRLSDAGVYAALKAMARVATVEDFSPHDLRRSYIGDLLDAGVDLVIVQQLAGHATPATTSRYDRRPFARRTEAVQRLQVPV